MFTLTISNRQLILAPDFGVPLLYKNPCWCFNEIPGPLCPDITVPYNDVNSNILGFPGRFAKIARSNDRKFPNAELRWRGFLYIYGTLVITDASDSGYSGYIQSELRSLSDLQREKMIGDHQLLGQLVFQNKQNYDPDSDLYCTIRLCNDGFWVDKGEQETVDEETRSVLTSKFRSTVDSIVNATTAEGVKVTATEAEVIVVSPFPFLHKLIELLLRDNKFFIRDNFLAADETLKTLCLYHNLSICKPTSVTQIIETVLNEYYFDGAYQGSTTAVQEIKTQTWETEAFQLRKLLPRMKLNEALLSSNSLTNTFFHFTGINDVDCIDRESLFDIQPFDLSKYRVSRWMPGKRQNLCLKFKFNHDPDDSEFNENFSDITSREEDIEDSVGVYADLEAIESPTVGKIRLVTSEKMWYEYRQETVADENNVDKEVLRWAPLSIDMQDFRYNRSGDDSEEIETKFSTLRMHKNGYPVAYQKGNSSQFSQFTENFSPRLLFYHGNNTGGSEATSGLDLSWKSLVPNRWRRTAPFYANALPVEADFRFPGNIFYKVLNEIYKPFLDKDGSYFIKEMEIQANNSEYVDARLTVFKNEDNVFALSTEIVDGGGEHAGGAVFVPKFIGVTEAGAPILIDEDGVSKPIPVFGNISTATFAQHTCIAYDQTDKLLFVGGTNGQLHVCDLADMDNIRYKTIQIFAGTDEVSSVSLTTYSSGVGKVLFVARANGCAAWLQPYHELFADYVSNQAVQIGSFANGSGWIRGIIVSGGYYYACSKDGEIHRASGWEDVWSQVLDVSAEYIHINQTTSRILVAAADELNSGFANKANPTSFSLFGLPGTKRQKMRDMQPLLADETLVLCADDQECIWKINFSGSFSAANITPTEINNAGGACFDGVKFAYISVKDTSGYMKIATYNVDPQIPEAVWGYLNVNSFFTKLFLY